MTATDGNENLATTSHITPEMFPAAHQNVSVGSFGNTRQAMINEAQNSGQIACGFKMEKPKMPRFSGDVRDYAIFRADFKHAIDTRYSKRDAISLLRTSLQGRPLDLIKGIGTDYDAAWGYLDSIYGDPRFVADTVT